MAADEDEEGDDYGPEPTARAKFEQPPPPIPLEYHKITYQLPGGTANSIWLYTEAVPDDADADYDDSFDLYRQLEEDRFVFGYTSTDRSTMQGIKTSRIISIEQRPLPDEMR